MLHVTAILENRIPADDNPRARVMGVFDSRDAARMHQSTQRGEVVLPVAWPAADARKPVRGDVLDTTREASGLCAVAPRNV
jgi:hypothetical protein